MIKKICKKLRFVSAFIIAFVSADNYVAAQSCGPATSFNYIEINNIRARINNGGDMFYNLANLGPQFNVPKVTDPNRSKKHTIFSSSLWIGAYSKGNLKTAAMTYRQEGVDFFAGPIDTINGSTTNTDCQKWDKIWRINRSTIDSFKAGLFTSTPLEIRDWPAHGDASKGHAKYLAPFIDVDKDGNYNPQAGDYPDIKGDQMLWWVFNDKGNIHTETGGAQLGIEVHASAYAYNQPLDTPLFHTIFVEYKIINRSIKDRLDSVYVGNFTDFDLGYAFDDYVGADSVLNAYYVYNGDADDEGVSGYGINPPSQAVILLNRKLSKFVYYNNTTNQNTGNPTIPEDYYNYLAGRWKDGKPLTYGGDGRTGSNIPADFMFPGNPTSTDPADWNERTAGIAPGDRRGLGTTGPLSFAPGSVETFTYAYVYTRNTESGSTGAINQMKKDLAHIRDFYAKDTLITNLITPASAANNNNITVFPNPAKEEVFIAATKNNIVSVRIINAIGQEAAYIRNQEAPVNSFSVKNFPAGFYTILVETTEGFTAKKLLIGR